MKSWTLLSIALLAIAQHFGAEVSNAGEEARGPDARRRALEREARIRGDAESRAACMVRRVREGERIDEMWLITSDSATIDIFAEAKGEVFVAKDHKAKNLPVDDLNQIDAQWRKQAEGWYNENARRLKPGDQFVTLYGKYRWTKVVAGRKEVWRAPDGLLVGDVVGRMTHFDAQRIDLALKKLYEQARQENGKWKWPDSFDAQAFLKNEMEQSIDAASLPGGDPDNIEGAHHVARFFNPLVASVGGIFDPNFPWRLPDPEGTGVVEGGPTREWSALRQQGVLEVSPDTRGRWFWTAALMDDHPMLAHFFRGESGSFYIEYRDAANGSVRLVARPR